ncbi:MAG: hypothetical protein AB7R89_25720 [Dehalococcoidia bacterium]
MAAGVVTITEAEDGLRVKRIKFEWTSGTDGEAGTASGETTVPYGGKVERLITDPDGTDAPTDNYDIEILDEDGYDVLAGAGANRDTANTEQVLASSLGIVAWSTLTLNVTNAGSAKSGVVYLYIL